MATGNRAGGLSSINMVSVRNQKISILYIVSTLRASGPMNVLLNVVKNLDRSRFRPNILTLSPEEERSMIFKFESLRIPIYSLGLSRLAGMVFGPKLLKRIVGQIKPDIIHCHGLRADLMASRYLRNYTTVSTLHNSPYEDYSSRFGKIRGRAVAWYHVNALSRLSAVVACSRSVAHKLNSSIGANSGRLWSIENGVDDELFYPASAEEKVKLRQRLGLPLKKPVFISVGHLTPLKDPLTILRAFLKSEVKDFSALVFVGDGPLLDECKELAGTCSNVYFTGRIHNVSDYLRASDWFLSASTTEGLPNSVLEALACGLPVCLSNIEPHFEILSKNETAGMVFPIRDVDRLATLIDECIHADRSSIAVAARSIVERYLSAKRMSLRYQQLYMKLSKVQGGRSLGKGDRSNGGL